MSRIVLYEEEQIKVENSSRFKKGHNPWNKGLSWKEQGVSNENKNKKLSNLRVNGKDGKSYREISLISSMEDIEWTYDSIGHAINRIQNEFKSDSILRNKWDIIKKLIYIDKYPDSYDTPFSDFIGRKDSSRFTL